MLSSHREAPLISQDPLADNTDVYAFVSPDRPDTATIIANYIPLEEPASGPTFFTFDPNALYSIYVDNTGDGEPDVTFDFKFKTTIANPNTFLTHLGTAGPGWRRCGHQFAERPGLQRQADLHGHDDAWIHSDTVRMFKRKSEVLGANLVVPPYNIGPGATPNYSSLAGKAIYNLPGGIQVFAGPARRSVLCRSRRSVRSAGTPAARTFRRSARQGLAGRLQRAQHCPAGPDFHADVGWSEAHESDSKECRCWNLGRSQPPHDFHSADDGGLDTNGKMVQVSRMGNPLVNELFSPLRTRDRWNATYPADDIQYRQDQVVAPGSSRACGSALWHEHAIEWRRCPRSETFPDDEPHGSRVDSLQGYTGEWNHGTQFHDRHRRRPE